MNHIFSESIKNNGKLDVLQHIDSSALLLNLDKIKTVDIRHGFNVGTLSLLVPKSIASEVIQADAIYSIPNTPKWFSGFVNHRGEALPVFYLEALFNPQLSEKKNKQWILFLEQQQKTCGLLINSCPYKLNNLMEIAVEHVLAIPEILKPHVVQAFYDGSSEWLDFSHHHFLLSLKSIFNPIHS
jgi:chemotaxis signal transduction protein